MPTKCQQPDELEAFCQSRPEPQDVITFLKQLGMRLDFQMEAFLPPVYSPLAQLPAQFHFVEASGPILALMRNTSSKSRNGWHCAGHSRGTIRRKHSRKLHKRSEKRTEKRVCSSS